MAEITQDTRRHRVPSTAPSVATAPQTSFGSSDSSYLPRPPSPGTSLLKSPRPCPRSTHFLSGTSTPSGGTTRCPYRRSSSCATATTFGLYTRASTRSPARTPRGPERSGRNTPATRAPAHAAISSLRQTRRISRPARSQPAHPREVAPRAVLPAALRSHTYHRHPSVVVRHTEGTGRARASAPPRLSLRTTNPREKTCPAERVDVPLIGTLTHDRAAVCAAGAQAAVAHGRADAARGVRCRRPGMRARRRDGGCCPCYSARRGDGDKLWMWVLYKDV